MTSQPAEPMLTDEHVDRIAAHVAAARASRKRRPHILRITINRIRLQTGRRPLK